MTAEPMENGKQRSDSCTTGSQCGRMCNHTHTHKIISLPSPAVKSSGLIAQLMRTITFAAGLPPPVEEESQPKAYKTLQL